MSEPDASPADTTADTTADSTDDATATPLLPAPTQPDTPQRPRGPSVPTIVWGLLFGLVAAVVIVGQTTEADLNLEVSGPVVLLVAGVVLVVWGVAGLGRSRRAP